jgi:endonuclease/exonuclease/phosphatase (EEP) superfamily protein YafD
VLVQALLLALGGAMIAATALPLVRAQAWWIRWFDFPRLQILAVSAAVLAAYLPFAGGSGLSLAFAALLAASAGYQCYMMFPYTPLCRRQVERARRATPESTVCVLFANVLMENRESAKLKAMIDEMDPDLVLAVEADEWWRRELAYLRERRPHAVEHPRDNTYGMLLYSRLELVGPRVKFLVQDDVPSIHGRLRLRGGEEVELRCLHPRPPAPQEAAESTERDAELLIVGRELKRLDAPSVVLGDLNDVAWSRTSYLFRDVSGLLDPRVGRGLYPTFHAKYPFMRYPLDHCFHSKHFRLASLRRLDKFGSDHFPMCIALSYEPEAAAAQPEPQAGAGEQREADEKIARAAGTRFATPAA